VEITIERKNGGFFNVSFCGVTIYGCSRKQGTSAKGDYDFISMPQKKVGEKWLPVVGVTRDLSELIMAAFLEGEGAESEVEQDDIPF